jgi:site-specific recombinase XerD
VDREQSALRVQRTGGQERWLALSPNGWYQLFSYLEWYRPKGGYVEEDHLFLSEWCQPLTINGIAQVLDRLKQRAGISEKPVSPSVLRDTFAVRYVQAGGVLEGLCEVLGLADVAALRRYERLSAQKSEHETPEELVEDHSSKSVPARQKSGRRQSTSSSAATQSHQQSGAGEPDSSGGKEPAPNAEED